MNPSLKAIIIEYKVYLNDKKAKEQSAKFNLRSLNGHLLKPGRT